MTRPKILFGRLIFIHLRCWEVLPFCRFQHQRCIKLRVLRAQDFYAPLALKTAKGQHLQALEVYKSQSPTFLEVFQKYTREAKNTPPPQKPHDVIFMLVLKDDFGGSLKITSENKNNFKAKKSLKRFLGCSKGAQ